MMRKAGFTTCGGKPTFAWRDRGKSRLTPLVTIPPDLNPAVLPLFLCPS